MNAISSEAQAVHDAALFVDLHNDLLLTTYFLGWDWRRRHRPNPLPGAPLMGHGDLPRFRDGGVGCLSLGIVINPLRGASGLSAIERDLARLDGVLRAAPDQIVLATTPDAIRAARREGRVACFASLEGAHGLGTSLDALPALQAGGLLSVGLAHFTRNSMCRPMVGWGSSTVEGLTDLGRELIDRMNDLGLVIDVAHVNRPGVLEVCARSRAPVICSHTAANAVYSSPRGLDDEQLRAIAATGGVVGLIFVTPFLGPGGLDAVVAHLDHLRRTVGVAHTAIGSDWDGFSVYPDELRSAERLPRLTEALLRAGWSPEDIWAIYGENFLRVLGEVQAARA